MEEASVHEIIVGAINAIEKYGWIQSTGGSTEIGFCTVGGFGHALRAAAGKLLAQDSLNPPVEAFLKVIGESPISFNDTPGRTKKEVLDALKKVAAAYAPEPDTEFLDGKDTSIATAGRSDDRDTTYARA